MLGKNGEKGEEVTDERLKGIEPKMIELIMNEVIFNPQSMTAIRTLAITHFKQM